VPFEAVAHCICLTKQETDVRDSEVTCTETEGISINPSPETLGVSNIVNEACTTVEVGVNQKTSFVIPTEEYQDLKQYLARPRIVTSGTVSTVRGNQVAVNLGKNILSVWFPNFLTRLTGVHAIRFTTRFTVTVAATPFQQALLAQSFQYGSYITNPTVYPRSSNSTFVTNLPHVVHDIAETTMSQLDVPFLYAYDYLTLSSTSINLDVGTAGVIGIYALNTLLPYRTIAGVAAPTYKIFVSLHDVELIGSTAMTYNAVTTQSGMSEHYPNRKKSVVRKGTNPIVKEEQSVKGSDKVLALSSKIRTISSYIPFLSSIGSTTSNLMDVGANVAKAFGYAKPQVEDHPARVWRNNQIGDCNVDIPTSSFVLAPFQSNRLAVDSLAGGTDVDEMAIQYVIGKYGQIFAGNIATTDAVGTPIYSTSVCPMNFWFRTNSGRPGGNLPLPAGATATTNAIALSPLAYTAQYFRYWRGTLTFKFTFSKTKFHGGRVMVGFIPQLDEDISNYVATAVVPALEVTASGPQPFSYSEVFDLRDASHFEFTVPYISQTPFTTILSSIGGVTMFVMDPLITSGEIAPTVDFLVEVKAEDDFEFGCPAPPMFSVATPGASSANTVFLQSGLDQGGVDTTDNTVTQYTTGESILSFKQLAMIPNYFSADILNLSISRTTLWPFWSFGRFTMAAPLPNNTSASFAFTRSGTIAAMYAFAAGSTEWHVYPYSGNMPGLAMNINAIATQFGTDASSLGDPRTRSTSSSQRVLTTDNALHVRVPSYQRVARVPIFDGNSAAGFTFGSINNTGSVLTSQQNQLVVNNTTGSNVRIAVGRSAADDARFMGYVGPPPVALLQSTQTVNPDNVGVFSLG